MRFFRDILRVGLVAIATLLALEGALRLARVRFGGSHYTKDPVRGYALRPNAEGWTTEENEVYVRINSAGMRDRERSVDVEPGSVRIAVLGSSETEARQVPLDQTFAALTENELAAATGRKVEVLNFGVPGYTLAQEYLTLRDHVWKYQPQVVLLSSTTFNVLQNTRALYSGELDTPFFVYRGGQLVLDHPRPAAGSFDSRRVQVSNLTADLMNGSALLSLANAARISVRRRLRTMWSNLWPRPLASNLPPDYTHRWEYLDPRDTSHPIDPRLQEAWRVNDGLLRMMRDDADRHGAEFWVLLVPLNMQIHPDLNERAKFQQKLGIASLDEANHRLEDFAKSEGIHILILAPILRQYAAAHHQALCGFWNTPFNDGHLNQQGHRVVAQALTEAFLGESALFGPSALDAEFVSTQRRPSAPLSSSSIKTRFVPLSHAMCRRASSRRP